MEAKRSGRRAKGDAGAARQDAAHPADGSPRRIGHGRVGHPAGETGRFGATAGSATVATAPTGRERVAACAERLTTRWTA